MVLTDVKKPSSTADKSTDNSRGQKSGKEGKGGVLAIQWKTFYIKSNPPCPFHLVL
jgi:hypothetical protein